MLCCYNVNINNNTVRMEIVMSFFLFTVGLLKCYYVCSYSSLSYVEKKDAIFVHTQIESELETAEEAL